MVSSLGPTPPAADPAVAVPHTFGQQVPNVRHENQQERYPNNRVDHAEQFPVKGGREDVTVTYVVVIEREIRQ